MDLSIVTTLHRSAATLEEFCRRTIAAAEAVTPGFEIILVNDGSPDNSLVAALALADEDPRIRVVDLSRNFGHHRAMMTGLAYAAGRRVFQQDCDLEEDPEVLPRFIRALEASGADVAYGVAERREGSLLHRATGHLFFKLFNAVGDVQIPENLTMTRLMSRRYVDALLLHQERQLFLAGLWALTGFAQVPVKVRKRRKGSSTYTLGRKVSMAVTAITAFSIKPLVLICAIGALISMLAFVSALLLVIRSVVFGGLLEGWPSLIVSIWLLGGLAILSTGVVGLYLATVFVEAKQRPFSIVRATYGWPDSRPLALDRRGQQRQEAAQE